MMSMPPPPPPPSSTPSLARQKTFIVENSTILSKQNEQDILNIVRIHSPDLIKTKKTVKGSSINLDRCQSETITAIYHIVKARRESLDKPVEYKEI